MEKVKENPFRYLEHYEGKVYKLRIGDYRAIIDVHFEDGLLVVHLLDKGGKFYKR